VTQLTGHDAVPRINGQLCAMLALDIAESTRPDRDEEIQLYLRDSVYGMQRAAQGACGMPLDKCLYEDRGDGTVVIFPPGLAAQPLIDSFPERLRDLIRRHNRCSCEPGRMQLRVAVNIGPVYCDEHGFAGDDVTLLCRMLDAQPVRQALSVSGGELAFVISDYIYEKLVLRRHGLADPKSFRRIRTHVKRTPIHAWIYEPDCRDRSLPPPGG
jgi:hypothetical protein